MPATPHSGRRPWFTACPVGHFWGWSGVRWGVDLRTNAQVPNSETECALCPLPPSPLQGRELRAAAGRRHSWLKEWPAQRLSLTCRERGAERGLGGQSPRGQEGSWKSSRMEDGRSVPCSVDRPSQASGLEKPRGEGIGEHSQGPLPKGQKRAK